MREIEDAIAGHEEALHTAWADLARRVAPGSAQFARHWRELAARRRFDAVNELIRLHNLWYPAEAKLPMDPRTRDFVLVGGAPYRRRTLDAAWILERFPAESAQAA